MHVSYYFIVQIVELTCSHLTQMPNLPRISKQSTISWVK
jgi:hypothetical protein